MLFRALKHFISGAFWLIAGVLALSLVTLSMAIMPFFGWVFGPAGGLLLLLILARSAKRVRRNRGTMVLHYLKQAVSLNLPIPPMLTAAQASERGVLSRRLGAVSHALEQGRSVSEALQAKVPELPQRSIDLMAAGERIGRLPSMLDRLTADERRRSHDHTYGSIFGWNYGIVLILFIMLILTGFSIFIMPKYHEIFEDFDVVLPWQIIVTTNILARIGLPGLIVMCLIIIATSGWAVFQMLHGVEGAKWPLQRLTDRLIWGVPVARSIVRDRGLADTCGLISEALISGDTIESAAYEAGELNTNIVLKRRIQHFADALRIGLPLRDAAEDARMPRLMVGMLATGQAVSDPARVFEFLGRYYAQRFSRAAALAQAAVLPGVVLSLSVVVAFVVYSMFLPLVVLLENTIIMTGVF